MSRFSQSRSIARPAAEVWPYLIAFEQVPLWENGVVEVRQMTPGEPRVGTRIWARRIYAGRETEFTGEIVDYHLGRSAAMVLRGGPHIASRVEYAVHPLDDRSSIVTYRGEARLGGLLRLLDPLLPIVGRAEARKNLRNLERRIEAGIPPRSPERA